MACFLFFHHLIFPFFKYFIHYIFISAEPRCTANFPFFLSGKFRPHSVPFLRPPLTAALLQLGKAQQVRYFVSHAHTQTLSRNLSFSLTVIVCHSLSGHYIIGLMNQAERNSRFLFGCRANCRMKMHRKFSSFLMSLGTHTLLLSECNVSLCVSERHAGERARSAEPSPHAHGTAAAPAHQGQAHH